MLNIKIENKIDTDKMLKNAKEYGKEITKNLADDIFSKSQSRCPVDSGNLKNSGSVKATSDGYLVEYDAPYALLVDTLPQSKLKSGTAHFLSGTLSEVLKGGVRLG